MKFLKGLSYQGQSKARHLGILRCQLALRSEIRGKLAVRGDRSAFLHAFAPPRLCVRPHSKPFKEIQRCSKQFKGFWEKNSRAVPGVAAPGPKFGPQYDNLL